MERTNKNCYNSRVHILLLCLTIAAACFNFSEAGRSSMKGTKHSRKLARLEQTIKKMRFTKHFDWASLLLQRETMDTPNAEPYVSSPFTLPPYESLPPASMPENTPPFCVYPPNTLQTPSSTFPTPVGYTPSPSFNYGPPVPPIIGPPPGPTGEVPTPPIIVPGPPEITPSPPEINPTPPIIIPGTPEGVPSPTIYVPSPPYYEPSPPSYVPGPPSYIPSPPTNVPSPGGGFVPSPTVFIPPIVYPPPTVPPPPRIVQPTARWCVGKPTVPDPILQEAMNYACGSGAECGSIQPNGPCFKPNTVLSHSSYAFNSYWQKTKMAGGTCSFGGVAMLVTVDPSFDGCHFIYA